VFGGIVVMVLGCGFGFELRPDRCRLWLYRRAAAMMRIGAIVSHFVSEVEADVVDIGLVNIA
jgi:hypothetical protein